VSSLAGVCAKLEHFDSGLKTESGSWDLSYLQDI